MDNQVGPPKEHLIIRYVDFDIGEEVYLRTDPDQYLRMITEIQINAESVVYTLSMGTRISSHYAIEITRDFNELKQVTS